jgi:hypothetical protein
MKVKDSTAAPSPEESEYFYDEYVEYQYEDGNSTASKNHSTLMLTTDIPLIVEPTSSDPVSASHTGVSSHYIAGDTPTFYAGSRHEKNKTSGINNVKQQTPAPPQASSGFTFFGIPLPSLSLGTLWGSGRNADAKSGTGGMRFIGARGKVQMLPPPVQSGGFVPMLPGSGGFVPIADPNIRQKSNNQSHGAHLDTEHLVRINYTTWSKPGSNNLSSHEWTIRPDSPPTHSSNIPFPISNLQVTPSTADQTNELQSTNNTSVNISHIEVTQNWQDKQKSVLQNDSHSKDTEENAVDHALGLSTPFSLTNYLDTEAARKPTEENAVFLSHFQQHKGERNASHEVTDGEGWGFIDWLETLSAVNETSTTQGESK